MTFVHQSMHLAGLLDLLDKGAVSAEELPKHIKELKARFNHTRTLLNNLLDWTLLQMDKAESAGCEDRYPSYRRRQYSAVIVGTEQGHYHRQRST
jgi:hypothetical protein